LVTKEIDTLREELTGAIDFLKLLGQTVAGLEKRVNNLVEAKELPDIQELKHYQVCHFSYLITWRIPLLSKRIPGIY